MKHKLSYSAPIIISESSVTVRNSERRVLSIFTLNPKICHIHSWKWFSFTYLISGCVSQRSIINNLLWPFQKAISVFCFCVWIRPSHCGQTDKQYSWTVTRSAVAFKKDLRKFNFYCDGLWKSQGKNNFIFLV